MSFSSQSSCHTRRSEQSDLRALTLSLRQRVCIHFIPPKGRGKCQLTTDTYHSPPLLPSALRCSLPTKCDPEVNPAVHFRAGDDSRENGFADGFPGFVPSTWRQCSHQHDDGRRQAVYQKWVLPIRWQPPLGEGSKERKKSKLTGTSSVTRWHPGV